MGTCVLRDCGFKFEKKEREDFLEGFLVEKAKIKFPFNHKLEEDDDFGDRQTAGPEVIIQQDTVLRHRPATMVERAAQTDPVELRPEDFNYFKDNIKKGKESIYSEDGPAMGSSNPNKTDHTAAGMRKRDLNNEEIKEYLKPGKFLTENQQQNNKRAKSPNNEPYDESEFGNGSGMGLRTESEYEDNQAKYGIFENEKNRNQKPLNSGRGKEVSENFTIESDRKKAPQMSDDEDLFKSEMSASENSTRRGEQQFRFKSKNEPVHVEDDEEDHPRVVKKKKSPFGGDSIKYVASPDRKGLSDDENLFKSEISENKEYGQEQRGRNAGIEMEDLDDDNMTSSRDMGLGLKTTLTAQVEAKQNQVKSLQEVKAKGFKLKIAVEGQDAGGGGLDSKSRSYGGGFQPDQKEDEANKSKTEGLPNALRGFDNEFFRKDLLKFMRARSPSPMNTQQRILPEDMSDEDDIPIVSKNRFKGKK